MSKMWVIFAYATLTLVIAHFCSARAYDRGFAEGYRVLAGRVLTGLREKREADAAADEYTP